MKNQAKHQAQDIFPAAVLTVHSIHAKNQSLSCEIRAKMAKEL
jgi:hypothetical protein